MKFIERLLALLECKTEAEWQTSILQLGNDFGFEQTLFSLAPHHPTSLSDVFIRSNFSTEWLAIYDQNDFINIDPTIAHCINNSTPLVWTPGIFKSKKQITLREEAAHFGLRSGITLPFHGANGEIGALYFATNSKPGRCVHRDILSVTPALSLMRDFAFQASLKFAKPFNRQPDTTLTDKEMICLRWCAQGKSSWEISQILNCAESTVNFHFLNLRKTLNATSRWHAVVIAIQLGLLYIHRHKNISNQLTKMAENKVSPL